MIKRTLAAKLLSLTRAFPVVSLLGPRQSGKTTLAKAVFKKHAYITLEDPDEKEFALQDPKGFLKRFPAGVILDEIQRVPQVLSYIQGLVASNCRFQDENIVYIPAPSGPDDIPMRLPS